MTVTFGQYMRDRRIDAHRTLWDVALHLELSAQSISSYELGKINPPCDSVLREWCRYLKISDFELVRELAWKAIGG